MGKTLEKTITIRISTDDYERLETLANAERRGRGDIAREGLEKIMDEIEWRNDLIRRAKAVREGKVKAQTLDEVMAEFGIESSDNPAEALDSIS